jgi:hypothetical protein
MPKRIRAVRAQMSFIKFVVGNSTRVASRSAHFVRAVKHLKYRAFRGFDSEFDNNYAPDYACIRWHGRCSCLRRLIPRKQRSKPKRGKSSRLLLLFSFSLLSRMYMWIQGFSRRFPGRSKYDYRDLWIQFAEIANGSPEIHDVLPKIAKFIAWAMLVRQVAFWVRSQSSAKFEVTYCLTGQHISASGLGLRLARTTSHPGHVIFRLGKNEQLSRDFPFTI